MLPVGGGWPEWHEYYLNNSNIPVYNARMLLNPKRKPSLTKYILWTDSVHLTDTSCFLHGLFNLDSQSDIRSANQYIYLRHWKFHLTPCNELGSVPPLISTLTTTKHKRRKRKWLQELNYIFICKHAIFNILIV